MLSTREVPGPGRCQDGAAQARRLVAELLGIHGSSILALSCVRMESRVRALIPCAQKAGASLPTSAAGALHTPQALMGQGLGPASSSPFPDHPQKAQGSEGRQCWDREDEAGREGRTFQQRAFFGPNILNKYLFISKNKPVFS